MTSGKEKWWSRTREVYTVQRRSKIIMKEKKLAQALTIHTIHILIFAETSWCQVDGDQQWEPELSFAEWVMTVKKK